MITERPGHQTPPGRDHEGGERRSARIVRESVRGGLISMVGAVAALLLGGCGHAATRDRIGVVSAVVDGDTIVVRGVGTVRYIGIDTPELHHPAKPLQRLARRARDENRRLVLGQAVRIVRDREQRDRYGRLLGYVYVGDRMVNAALVRRGFARTLPIAPNTVHAALFASLERAARQARIGLWGPSEGGPPWGVP
jgi:micrococcal nuclease